VFSRSWQFVGDVGLVKTGPRAHPFTLLEGFIDEPLVLTRDVTDELRYLSNVCTHRGDLLAQEPGPCGRTLRCRYHGRRFALDGRHPRSARSIWAWS
jgi:choline monooxygenase